MGPLTSAIAGWFFDRWGPRRKRRELGQQAVDLSKRALLGSAVGGVVALAAMRFTPQGRGTRFNPLLIRPPGARVEREFLQRCTGCGICENVCPFKDRPAIRVSSANESRNPGNQPLPPSSNDNPYG